VKEKVDRYMQDIGARRGCTVEVEVLEGGTAVEIKDILKSYYSDGGPDGAVQIGSLPVGWMEFYHDPFFGEYESIVSSLRFFHRIGSQLIRRFLYGILNIMQ
jgi:hypothetical protein